MLRDSLEFYPILSNFQLKDVEERLSDSSPCI